jgi:hypothetical protein
VIEYNLVNAIKIYVPQITMFQYGDTEITDIHETQTTTNEMPKAKRSKMKEKVPHNI